jgi:hypothetical protein
MLRGTVGTKNKDHHRHHHQLQGLFLLASSVLKHEASLTDISNSVLFK